jgi:hypothetical protein
MYFTSNNRRIFDVLIENVLRIDNLDIHAVAGPKTAYIREFQNISVTDGVLNLNFVASVNRPIINAIEVIQQQQVATPTPTPVTPTPTPQPTATPSPTLGNNVYRINAGGPQVLTGGKLWCSSHYVTNGIRRLYEGASIANTNDDLIYQTIHLPNFQSGETEFIYTMPVPNGSYTVLLHFAEMFHNAAGQRKFSVDVEGVRQITNLDVWAATGGSRRAHIRTLTTTVSDGQLTLRFYRGTDDVDNPFVSAIEVWSPNVISHPNLPCYDIFLRDNGASWSAAELAEIEDAVEATSRAFARFTGQPVYEDRFRRVMGMNDGAGRLIVGPLTFVRVNNRPNCITDNNFRTITCGNLLDSRNQPRPLTSYVLIHELGHVFDNSTARGGFQRLAVSAFQDPETIMDCQPQGVAPQIVTGTVAGVWRRGERGWGSGPALDASGAPLYTDFQQNPILTGSFVADEFVADMFLNWVERINADGSPEAACAIINQPLVWEGPGFLNMDWRNQQSNSPQTIQTHPNLLDNTMSGEQRYDWFHDAVAQAFQNHPDW